MPVRFGEDANQFSLRKRNDGQVVAEFQHQASMEKITLSTLQLLEALACVDNCTANRPCGANIPGNSSLPSVAWSAIRTGRV